MSELQEQPRQTPTGRGRLDRETKTGGDLEQEGKTFRRSEPRRSVWGCLFRSGSGLGSLQDGKEKSSWGGRKRRRE